MNPSRTTARIVGILFLVVNITFIVGAAVFVEAILGTPDYLTLVSANRTQLALGVLLELINGIAYVTIAVLMFPILKQRFESLALGYVGFRIVEFVMQIASDLSPLVLVTLSQEFVQAGAPDSSAYQTLGTALLAGRSSAFLIISLTFSLGALLFYFMLYRSKLIPRFISVWGLLGGLLVLVSFVFGLFGFGLGPDIDTALGLPMLLNELFLGVWLIIKGFDPSAMID